MWIGLGRCDVDVDAAEFGGIEEGGGDLIEGGGDLIERGGDLIGGVGGKEYSSCSFSPLPIPPALSSSLSFPFPGPTTGNCTTSSESASGRLGSASKSGVSAIGLVPEREHNSNFECARTWMYHPRVGRCIVYLSAFSGSGVRISSISSLCARMVVCYTAQGRFGEYEMNIA